MTTISPVAGSTTTTQTHSTSSALSSDFDTFLTMLTAQIQNQDPLEPQLLGGQRLRVQAGNRGDAPGRSLHYLPDMQDAGRAQMLFCQPGKAAQ